MKKNTRTPKFGDVNHNRYWWYRLRGCDYSPMVFSSLSNAEWQVMSDWFEDTEQRFQSPGEMSVPAISLISGLISGNGLGAIVQCGHYAGYSTLLVGFLLRSMGKNNSFFSVDIDPVMTKYTNSFVKKGELDEQVRLHIGDSADIRLPEIARDYLGRDPELIIIDSSHQYDHTLKELDLWYKALPIGGLILMHDVSKFAQSFDSTNRGGVRKALLEWSESRQVAFLALNEFVVDEPPNQLVYKDGCGIALIQKQK